MWSSLNGRTRSNTMRAKWPSPAAVLNQQKHMPKPPYGKRKLGRAEYGPVATDADLVVLRRPAAGDAAWGAVNMTHVYVDGARVHAARPFQVFQTDGTADVVGRAKWRRWSGTISPAARRAGR